MRVWPTAAAALATFVAAGACANGTDIGDLPPADGVEGGTRRDDGGRGDPGDDGDEDGRPDGGKAPTVPAACASALAMTKFAFEGSDQGWTHDVSDNAAPQAPTWPFDPWSRGTATPACPSGECFGSERTKNYAQCQRAYLVSPSIDLSACSGQKLALSFRHAYAFWSGTYASAMWFDGGIVEISSDNGATWSIPAGSYTGTVKINPNRGAYACVLNDKFYVHGKQGFVGTQAAVTTITLAIPSAAVTDKVRVRFSQASGVAFETFDADTSRAHTASGWRIDDVAFIAPSP